MIRDIKHYNIFQNVCNCFLSYSVSMIWSGNETKKWFIETSWCISEICFVDVVLIKLSNNCFYMNSVGGNVSELQIDHDLSEPAALFITLV